MTATFTPIPAAINGAGTTQLNGPVLCAVWGDPTSTNTTTLSTIMETNTASSGLISTATGGNNRLVLSTNYSPETKLGLSNGMILWVLPHLIVLVKYGTALFR